MTRTPWIKTCIAVVVTCTVASVFAKGEFAAPSSKKVEPKKMYCERLDETVVSGGVYKN